MKNKPVPADWQQDQVLTRPSSLEPWLQEHNVYRLIEDRPTASASYLPVGKEKCVSSGLIK